MASANTIPIAAEMGVDVRDGSLKRKGIVMIIISIENNRMPAATNEILSFL